MAQRNLQEIVLQKPRKGKGQKQGKVPEKPARNDE